MNNDPQNPQPNQTNDGPPQPGLQQTVISPQNTAVQENPPLGQPVEQPTPQPEQQTTQPTSLSSYDYLESISAQAKNPSGFSKKQLFFFGGAGLFVILFIILAVTMSGSSVDINDLSYTALAKTKSIEEVTKKSQSTIRSHDLVTINSGLTSQLATTEVSLTKSLGDIGIETDKIPSEVSVAEDNTELLEKLDDAELAGTFDRVYINEISFQLKSLVGSINDIAIKTSDESLVSSLNDLQKELTAYQERLDSLNV